MAKKKRPPQHSHRVWIARTRALRVQRAEVGVSVTRMASDIGCDRSHLSRVLNGRCTSDRMARRISEYFQVPITELFVELDLEAFDQTAAA